MKAPLIARPHPYLLLSIFAFHLAAGPVRGAFEEFALQTGRGTYFRTLNSEVELFRGRSCTIEFWFMAETPGVLLNEVDAFDPSKWDHSLLELRPDLSVSLQIPGSSGSLSSGPISTGAWHHVAFRYDDERREAALYLNGERQGILPAIRQTPGDVGRTAYLAFGRAARNPPGTGGYFNGNFDAIRIWTTALPDELIKANIGARLGPAEGLSANWRLEEGNGPVLDDSGNNHPAFFEGATWIKTGVSLEGPMTVLRTEAPLNFTTNSATLNGAARFVEPGWSVFFEWGSTSKRTNRTLAVAVDPSTNWFPFTALVSELAPGSYEYRVGASRGTNELFGNVRVFTIESAAKFAVSLRNGQYLRTSRGVEASFQSDSFTFAFWLRPRGPGVLVNEVDRVNGNIWNVSILELFPGGRLRMGLPGLGQSDFATIPFGEWHQITGVYDEELKLFTTYLDGTLSGSVSGTRIHPRSINRDVVYAFGRGSATNLGGGTAFSGELDEIAIWDRPLSADEIAENWNFIQQSSSARQVALWHLDETEQNISPDSSPALNDAFYEPFTEEPELVLSTAPIARNRRPYVFSFAAANLNGAFALFRAEVNPQGTPSMAWFEYGLTNLEFRTAPQNLGEGESPVVVTAELQSLLAGKEYRVRVVSSNAFGQVKSDVATFVKSGAALRAVNVNGSGFLRSPPLQEVLTTNDSLTIELWVKPFRAGVIASETSAQDERSIIEVLPSGSVEVGFRGFQPLSAGTMVYSNWNHIALRFDSIRGEMAAFLNGIPSETRVGTHVALPATTFSFAFGKNARTKLGTGDSLRGVIDEVRVWKTARSFDHVVRDSQILLTGGEDNLLFYWRADETSGGTLADASNHALHGQVVGASFVVSDAPLFAAITPLTVVPGSRARLEFPAVAGRGYLLHQTSDFAVWEPILTNSAVDPGLVSFEIPYLPGTSPFRFYRTMQR